MLLDEPTEKAINAMPIEWLRDEPDPNVRSYRAHGFDPTIFPKGWIPFKRVALNEQGTNRHVLAAMYYALAYGSGKVKGPPVALATLELSSAGFVSGYWKDTLHVTPDQCTLHLKRAITIEDYEGFADTPMVQPLLNGDDLLRLGQMLLQRKRRAP